MLETRIMGVETANPQTKWTQEEVLASVNANEKISKKSKSFYKRFLKDGGIESRYFGMNSLDHVNSESPDEANERFAKVATEIGVLAVNKCLAKFNLPKEDVDALIVTTCTGYLCPGLTSYIVEEVGLKDSIYAIDLAGLGCGAAIPALRSADQYLKSHPESNVLVVSVEVCSAALSWGDEIDLILSNALFSDGAAATLLSNREGCKGYVIDHFESLLLPQYREELRFKTKESRLCNVIHPSVPKIASQAVQALDERLRKRNGRVSEYYGVHPGGRKILDSVQEVLNLEENALERSRYVLKEYGNMSSPSILYVLKEIHEKDSPKAGKSISLFAFGAGFSAFGILIKSDGA